MSRYGKNLFTSLNLIVRRLCLFVLLWAKTCYVAFFAGAGCSGYIYFVPAIAVTNCVIIYNVQITAVGIRETTIQTTFQKSIFSKLQKCHLTGLCTGGLNFYRNSRLKVH